MYNNTGQSISVTKVTKSLLRILCNLHKNGRVSVDPAIICNSYTIELMPLPVRILPVHPVSEAQKVLRIPHV